MGEHDCENCIFSTRCTPFEKQIDNKDNFCMNYIDIDFNDYRFAYRGVSWEKYKDNSWNYRIEV